MIIIKKFAIAVFILVAGVALLAYLLGKFNI